MVNEVDDNFEPFRLDASGKLARIVAE